MQFFDTEWYLATNPDVAAAVARGDITAEAHFELYGKLENRSPSPLFDPELYLRANPDVAAAVQAGETTAFDHFVGLGADEGRDASLFFDPDVYLAANPDVAAAIQAGEIASAYEHFVLHGENEIRNTSQFFDLKGYLDANPDVAAAVREGQVTAFDHFLQYGFKESRELGNGIDLSQFTNDPQAQAAIASGDVEGLMQRVAEIAPFLPTYEPPAGYTIPANQPIPTDFVPVEGEGLVVPEGVNAPDNLPPGFQEQQDPSGPTGPGGPAPDKTAPAAPEVDQVTVGENSNAEMLLVVTGNAEPGSRVRVWDGDALLGATVVEDGGQWRLAVPADNDTAKTNYSISATATDSAKNQSLRSDALEAAVFHSRVINSENAHFSGQEGTIALSQVSFTDDSDADTDAEIKVYGNALETLRISGDVASGETELNIDIGYPAGSGNVVENDGYAPALTTLIYDVRSNVTLGIDGDNFQNIMKIDARPSTGQLTADLAGSGSDEQILEMIRKGGIAGGDVLDILALELLDGGSNNDDLTLRLMTLGADEVVVDTGAGDDRLIVHATEAEAEDNTNLVLRGGEGHDKLFIQSANAAGLGSIDFTGFETVKMTNIGDGAVATFRDADFSATMAEDGHGYAAEVEFVGATGSIQLDNVAHQSAFLITGKELTTLNISGSVAPEAGGEWGQLQIFSAVGNAPMSKLASLNLALTNNTDIGLYDETASLTESPYFAVSILDADASTGGLNISLNGIGAADIIAWQSLRTGSGSDIVTLDAQAFTEETVTIDLGSGADELIVGGSVASDPNPTKFLVIGGGSADDIDITGSGNVDTIRYNAIEDSRLGTLGADNIKGFGEDDLIDLTGVARALNKTSIEFLGTIDDGDYSDGYGAANALFADGDEAALNVVFDRANGSLFVDDGDRLLGPVSHDNSDMEIKLTGLNHLDQANFLGLLN